MPRADVLLVELGLAPTRSRAQALIKAGHVFAGDSLVTKAGLDVPYDAELRVEGTDCEWVSRGGLKLAHAIEHFKLNPTGLIALDVGASTGGFTDVLLHHGAQKVYAVDVGHEQLAEKLRQDERVISLEGVNARHLTEDNVPELVNIVVCDASFISLTLVLPACLARAAKGAWCVALIKPQFEAGKENVGKNGVVKDTSLHSEICARIENWFSAQGWNVLGITDSPIQGPSGNHEFLIAARLPE